MQLPVITLPLPVDAWQIYFSEHFRKVPKVQDAYDTTRICTLAFDADELGTATVCCEREIVPLRWVFRPSHRQIQLVDDSGNPETPIVTRMAFEQPGVGNITSAHTTSPTTYRVPTAGGMFVARRQAVKEPVAIIVPPEVKDFTDLGCNPQIAKRSRSLKSVKCVVDIAKLWGNARVSGDWLSTTRRQTVLRKLACDIARLVCGDKWALAEAGYLADNSDNALFWLGYAMWTHHGELEIGRDAFEAADTLANTTTDGRIEWLESHVLKYRTLSAVCTNTLDARWFAELSFRLASAPDSAPGWTGRNLEGGLVRLLGVPSLHRAARLLVLATDRCRGGTFPCRTVRRLEMVMRRLTAEEVHARHVEHLGLDSDAIDLTASEAIAAALRRMASLKCPCTTRTLALSVMEPLRGLVDDEKAMKTAIQETLEAMIAYGDILELPSLEENSDRKAAMLLYVAPPSFVVRDSGAVLLVGVPPYPAVLPEELSARVKYTNHVRRISPLLGENLSAELRQLGFTELSYGRWLGSPLAETPTDHVARVDRMLDSVRPSYDVPGLSILDPGSSVRYYRGRWVDPKRQSGRFVGRRKQAYGNDLWCYVQLTSGSPERVIDFPLKDGRWRACDEAWRLQMAIDARRGEAQTFRTLPGPGRTRVMQFFSPVPMWAQRRLDAIGEPVVNSGCLFAYRFSTGEYAEERRFAREELWLAETIHNGRTKR